MTPVIINQILIIYKYSLRYAHTTKIYRDDQTAQTSINNPIIINIENDATDNKSNSGKNVFYKNSLRPVHTTHIYRNVQSAQSSLKN